MKFLFGILIVALAATGCASKSKKQLRQQNAFLAGQNALLQQQQQQTPSVTVMGPVQNSQVPWVVGLTLAQAIATANYLDSHEPKEIVITRQGENASLDPKVLFKGADVPLEPGDIITLR